MPTNRHQIIIDAVATRLNAITVAAGYHLNLGTYGSVQRPIGQQISNGDWSVDIIDHDEDTVNESTRPDVTGNKEHRALQLDIDIARQQETPAVDNEIRKAIADVRYALGHTNYVDRGDPGEIDRTLGGVCRNIVPLGWTIPKNELGQFIVGQASVRFRIDYKTTIFEEA